MVLLVLPLQCCTQYSHSQSTWAEAHFDVLNILICSLLALLIQGLLIVKHLHNNLSCITDMEERDKTLVNFYTHKCLSCNVHDDKTDDNRRYISFQKKTVDF